MTMEGVRPLLLGGPLSGECACEDDYVEWVYKIAHECMYGFSGQLSFVLGCASIGFWVVTQVSEKEEECACDMSQTKKRKRKEVLSAPQVFFCGV